jgi:hypothetical protein
VAELVRVAHAGALREEGEEAALAQDRAGGLERLGVGLPAPHRERPEPYEQRAVAGLDQLGLRHEAQMPPRADGNEERVPEALVIGRDDRGSLGRDMLGAGHVHAKPDPQERGHDCPYDRV